MRVPNRSAAPSFRAARSSPRFTPQILENWRSKRVVDPQKVDDILSTLSNRTAAADEGPASAPAPASSSALSKNEVFERIEEDRERHKRLRERRWVQPISHHPQASLLPPPLASFMPLGAGAGAVPGDLGGAAEGEAAAGSGWARGEELTIDIEFENEWEATSDWNEDDDEAVVEENELCFQAERAAPMDVP